jgi:hypothetical protein
MKEEKARGAGGLLSFIFICLLVLCAAGTCHAQLEGEYQIQPIFTRYAETAKKITFNATARVFKDAQLQEVDRFDGWGVDADLTVPIPFTKTFQLRVFWPFYTEGDARLIAPRQPDTGQRIDVRGYGGTFDFPNIQLEWQFLKEEKHCLNMAVYGGAGERQRVLWTTTEDSDIYNHEGDNALFGLKADWRCGDDWRFAANAGARYYYKSDDLNPAGPSSSDRFWQTDISAAAIYHPWTPPVFPVAELVYNGDFSDYHSVLFVPEVIFGICRNFELKAGAPIGLTGDGESIGGRFQGTFRF